jgi:hypothetical protein
MKSEILFMAESNFQVDTDNPGLLLDRVQTPFAGHG